MCLRRVRAFSFAFLFQVHVEYNDTKDDGGTINQRAIRTYRQASFLISCFRRHLHIPESTGNSSGLSGSDFVGEFSATGDSLSYGNTSSEAPKIIATFSFTESLIKNKWEPKMVSILLSVGQDSIFVDPLNEFINVGRSIGALGFERHWGIYCCDVSFESLREQADLLQFMEMCWTGKDEADSIHDIAMHVYLLGTIITASPSLKIIEAIYDDRSVSFDLQPYFKDGKTDIDLESHLHRNKPLHDHLLASNNDYKQRWQAFCINQGDDKAAAAFYKATYGDRTTTIHPIFEPTSFMFPTIQYGFRLAKNGSAARYPHHRTGDVHHKFTTHKRSVDPKHFSVWKFRKIFMQNYKSWCEKPLVRARSNCPLVRVPRASRP